MTIQEKTIEWLTLLKEKFIGTEYSIYLDAAIKAFEQQPSEDCVSRESIVNKINSLQDELKSNNDSKWNRNKLAYKYMAYVVNGIILSEPSIAPKGVTVTDFADRCRECGREKVLDKIRAEIKALTDGAEPERIWNVDALAIIDKYKIEGEEE